MSDHPFFAATLREWLAHQRPEHTPHPVALNAAIDQADPWAVRQLLADAPFSPEQRRYLDDLLERWQEVAEEPPEDAEEA